MDIVGIAFDGEMKGYITIAAIKISKWIDPNDYSLDIIFRLTIEHKYKDDRFRKIRKFYVYFTEEDLMKIIIDRNAIERERERLEKSLSERSKERKLEEGISPLEGYIYPILTREVIIEYDGERKRIRVDLSDYDLTEDTVKRNILFTLKFEKSVFSHDSILPETAKPTWYYDCLIEPYLVQTLKWSKEEFMPLIESLELWLQIPEKLYKSLSEVNVQPMGHFEQMFLLGKNVAKRFQDAGQPLAEEKTLCINWLFTDVSISSPAEEIEVTWGLRESRVEESFARRFDDNPENFILTLRELLYRSKIQMIDFGFITSRMFNRDIKKILEIFNTMVFQRNRRSMKENLKILLPELEHLRSLKHGEEFFNRYDTFYALIHCDKSQNFFSDETMSRLRRFDEFEDMLDPEYKTIVKDFSTLVELTKKFSLYDMDKDKLRYRNEILSMIDRLDQQWAGKFTHPDKYILLDILTNWKHIIEKEYEEHVPKPEISATIRTKHLAFTETIGIVFSIINTGKGEASEVQARLLPSDDYDIITKKSEIKAYLTNKGKPFEPELMIKTKNDKTTVVLYEICYKDSVGKYSKEQFEETIEFIEEEIPFQKIENPYIIGDVVRDSRMFYGRKELLTSIIDNFRGKYQINPVFLYGQRRTGKTSTLIQLKKRLKNDFAPVFFTTQEILGGKSFYQDLMEKIREEIGFIDIEIPDIKENPFEDFKNEFYAKIEQKLKGKKIVIMIDEYQRIDEFITRGNYDDEVIDFLNALVQDGEIKLIFAGPLLPEELENMKWTELMKFFITMKVSFLSRNDTIKLIVEPVKGLMEYDEGGIEKTILLSGSHPYFVQLICHTMVEHHNRDEVVLIGYNNVATHLYDYFERGHNVLSDIILAQTNEIQHKILFYMYDFMEKKKTISVHRSEIEWDLMSYEEGIGRDEIQNSLFHLERREIIRRSVDHPDQYEFEIDLYRLWVKWNLRPK